MFIWTPPHLPGVNLTWRWAKTGSFSKLPPVLQTWIQRVLTLNNSWFRFSKRRLGTFWKTGASLGVLFPSDWWPWLQPLHALTLHGLWIGQHCKHSSEEIILLQCNPWLISKPNFLCSSHAFPSSPSRPEVGLAFHTSCLRKCRMGPTVLQPGICSAQRVRGMRYSHRTGSTGAVWHCPFTLQIRAFFHFCEPAIFQPCVQQLMLPETRGWGNGDVWDEGQHRHPGPLFQCYHCGHAVLPHLTALFKQQEGSFLGYPVPLGACCSLGMAVPGIQVPGSQADGEQEHWRLFHSD